MWDLKAGVAMSSMVKQRFRPRPGDNSKTIDVLVLVHRKELTLGNIYSPLALLSPKVMSPQWLIQFGIVFVGCRLRTTAVEPFNPMSRLLRTGFEHGILSALIKSVVVGSVRTDVIVDE
jgi:hypothetical protein